YKLGSRSLESAMCDSRFSLEALSREVVALWPQSVWQHFIAETRYAGYISQHLRRMSGHDCWPDRSVPTGLDFSLIPGLRAETRQKLGSVRPTSLAEARRI